MTQSGTAIATSTSIGTAARLDWVDYAKGICIIMVVMMHSTLGVEKAADGIGFMHAVVEFAKPFRMPDFFLISGLFLAVVIDRDWRTYLDRKVVHFAYFYLLWMTIQLALKAPMFAAESGWSQVVVLYLESFIEPFGTLWFIYLLPVFFVVVRLTRSLPAPAIWCVAAALEILRVQTGWTAIDEFAARFIYFYSGYLFATKVLALAALAQRHVAVAAASLVLWAVIDATLVDVGLSEWPGISLALGFSGACAVITTAALLAKLRWLDGIRYCGEHSIVIYLGFFLPMAVTRTLLLKSGIIHDLGAISAIVTIVGVLGALAMWWSTRNTALAFLYQRPAAFWLTPKQRSVQQAAE